MNRNRSRLAAAVSSGVVVLTAGTMLAPEAMAYPPGVTPDAGVVGRPPAFNTPFTLVARKFDPSCKIKIRIWNTSVGGKVDRTFTRGPGVSTTRINTRLPRLVRFNRKFKMTASQTCNGKTVVIKRRFTVQPF